MKFWPGDTLVRNIYRIRRGGTHPLLVHRPNVLNTVEEYKEINGVKDYYMVVPGVKEDGSLNDIPVSAQTYYSTIGFVQSAKGYMPKSLYVDASW